MANSTKSPIADQQIIRSNKNDLLFSWTQHSGHSLSNNILRGDMSFVGPRPERAYFYREFEKYIPGFSNRLLVTPGLTGYAQVNGGYSLKPEEKIIYDMEYIQHRSIRMDLACILRTIGVIFSGDGAR